MKTAMFSIASYNYTAYVRALMKSIANTNPEWDRFFIVADDPKCSLYEECDIMAETISYTDIGIADARKMSFRYNVIEFNTAVKPYAFKYLFGKRGYDRVIYLDPDIYAYKKMNEIEDAFDKGYNFILIPHILGEMDDDGFIPTETSFLTSGIYNLGFLGLQKSDDTLSAVEWWMKRCEENCVSEPHKGVFVDQKWIDFFPSRYRGVKILRHRGYNVAYWNLHEREMRTDVKGEYLVDGQTLVFFHFSGIEPGKKSLSKYSNRPLGKNDVVVTELIEEYTQSVFSENHEKWRDVSYGYNRFSDNRIIDFFFRKVYRRSRKIQERCGIDPFLSASFWYENKEEIEGESPWNYYVRTMKRISMANEIIIFGAGGNGVRILELLKNDGQEEHIKAFCDNHIGRIDKIQDIPVIKPADAVRRFNDALYVITPDLYWDIIEDQLVEYGIPGNHVMRFDISYMV